MTIMVESPRVGHGTPEEDWRFRGSCRDKDNTLFFPLTEDDGEEPPYPSPEAKAVCDLCPVRHECLEYALTSRIPYGIFGGQSAYERSLILKPKSRKRCPGCGSEDVLDLGHNQVCIACGISWDRNVPVDDESTD
jgi:WhiB family redox-sensing transcriptional regulator